MVNFGDLIKSARKEKRKTIREAAELVNISYPYFSQLENNKNFTPSKSILLRLSFNLGIKYSHLVHFSNTKISNEFSDDVYSLSKFLPLDVFDHLNDFEDTFLPYLREFFKNNLPVADTPMYEFTKKDKQLSPFTQAVLQFPIETIDSDTRELFNLLHFYLNQERDLFILYLQDLVNEGEYERAKEIALVYNRELRELLNELDELINFNPSDKEHVTSLKNRKIDVLTLIDRVDSILKSIENRGIRNDRVDTKILGGFYFEGEETQHEKRSHEVATLIRSINDTIKTDIQFTQINLETVLKSNAKIIYKERALSKIDKDKLLKLLELYFS